MKVCLSIMITNCCDKRFFSKVNRIKNRLQSSMTRERLGLDSLPLMCIKMYILNKIYFEGVVNITPNMSR